MVLGHQTIKQKPTRLTHFLINRKKGHKGTYMAVLKKIDPKKKFRTKNLEKLLNKFGFIKSSKWPYVIYHGDNTGKCFICNQQKRKQTLKFY